MWLAVATKLRDSDNDKAGHSTLSPEQCDMLVCQAESDLIHKQQADTQTSPGQAYECATIEQIEIERERERERESDTTNTSCSNKKAINKGVALHHICIDLVLRQVLASSDDRSCWHFKIVKIIISQGKFQKMQIKMNNCLNNMQMK